MSAGHLLFDEGRACPGLPLVLSGAIRVALGSPTGRRLELYRVTQDELCVVSTFCLFGHAAPSEHGQTVDATELVLPGPDGFEAWCRHEPFRRDVFGVCSVVSTVPAGCASRASASRCSTPPHCGPPLRAPQPLIRTL